MNKGIILLTIFLFTIICATNAMATTVAHWQFDETAGLIAQDVVGGHNGTIYNSSGDVAWTSDSHIGDGALAIGNPSDRIIIADNSPVFADTNDFTISVWIKPHEISDRFILAKTGAYSDIYSKGYELRMDGWGSKLMWYAGGGSVFDDSVFLYGMQENKWYNIIAMREGATAKLYVNGMLVGEKTGLSPITYTGTTPLMIGGVTGGAGWSLDSVIDDVEFYNTALTQAQIDPIYSPFIIEPTEQFSAEYLYSQALDTLRVQGYAGNTAQSAEVRFKNSADSYVGTSACVPVDQSQNPEFEASFTNVATTWNKDSYNLEVVFFDDVSCGGNQLTETANGGEFNALRIIWIEEQLAQLNQTIQDLNGTFQTNLTQIWNEIDANSVDIDGIESQINNLWSTINAMNHGTINLEFINNAVTVYGEAPNGAASADVEFYSSDNTLIHHFIVGVDVDNSYLFSTDTSAWPGIRYTVRVTFYDDSDVVISQGTKLHSIILAAEHLFDVQNGDGGWSWTIPPGISSSDNIIGEVAIGLVGAYEKTGDADYLAAIDDAYLYINNTIAADSCSMFSFLVKASEVTGDGKYAALAQDRWDARKAYFGSAADWAAAIVTARTNQGYAPTGLLGYDLDMCTYDAVALDSYFSGYGADANAFAEAAYQWAYVNESFNVSNDASNWYMMGINGLYNMFQLTGLHASEAVTLRSTLLSHQQTNGGFPDSSLYSDDYQTTAYVIRTLLGDGANDAVNAAREAADWLISTQNSDGVWDYSGTEYPSISGMALYAISLATEDETVSTVFEALFTNYLNETLHEEIANVWDAIDTLDRGTVYLDDWGSSTLYVHGDTPIGAQMVEVQIRSVHGANTIYVDQVKNPTPETYGSNKFLDNKYFFSVPKSALGHDRYDIFVRFFNQSDCTPWQFAQDPVPACSDYSNILEVIYTSLGGQGPSILYEGKYIEYLQTQVNTIRNDLATLDASTNASIEALQNETENLWNTLDAMNHGTINVRYYANESIIRVFGEAPEGATEATLCVIDTTLHPFAQTCANAEFETTTSVTTFFSNENTYNFGNVDVSGLNPTHQYNIFVHFDLAGGYWVNEILSSLSVDNLQQQVTDLWTRINAMNHGTINLVSQYIGGDLSLTVFGEAPEGATTGNIRFIDVDGNYVYGENFNVGLTPSNPNRYTHTIYVDTLEPQVYNVVVRFYDDGSYMLGHNVGAIYDDLLLFNLEERVNQTEQDVLSLNESVGALWNETQDIRDLLNEMNHGTINPLFIELSGDYFIGFTGEAPEGAESARVEFYLPNNTFVYGENFSITLAAANPNWYSHFVFQSLNPQIYDMVVHFYDHDGLPMSGYEVGTIYDTLAILNLEARVSTLENQVQHIQGDLDLTWNSGTQTLKAKVYFPYDATTATLYVYDSDDNRINSLTIPGITPGAGFEADRTWDVSDWPIDTYTIKVNFPDAVDAYKWRAEFFDNLLIEWLADDAHGFEFMQSSTFETFQQNESFGRSIVWGLTPDEGNDYSVQLVTYWTDNAHNETLTQNLAECQWLQGDYLNQFFNTLYLPATWPVSEGSEGTYKAYLIATPCEEGAQEYVSNTFSIELDDLAAPWPVYGLNTVAVTPDVTQFAEGTYWTNNSVVSMNTALGNAIPWSNFGLCEVTSFNTGFNLWYDFGDWPFNVNDSYTCGGSVDLTAHEPTRVDGEPEWDVRVCGLPLLGQVECDYLTFGLDTQAPSINFIYPGALDAIHGTVMFTANVTDDGVIKYVDITLVNKSDAEQTWPLHGATYNATSGLWELLVNTTQVPDGYYNITVDAWDFAGNFGTSTIDPLIDNTAPVVALYNIVGYAPDDFVVQATLTDNLAGVMAANATIVHFTCDDNLTGVCANNHECTTKSYDGEFTENVVLTRESGTIWDGVWMGDFSGEAGWYYEATVTAVDGAGNLADEVTTASYLGRPSYLVTIAASKSTYSDNEVVDVFGAVTASDGGFLPTLTVSLGPGDVETPLLPTNEYMGDVGALGSGQQTITATYTPDPLCEETFTASTVVSVNAAPGNGGRGGGGGGGVYNPVEKKEEPIEGPEEEQTNVENVPVETNDHGDEGEEDVGVEPEKVEAPAEANNLVTGAVTGDGFFANAWPWMVSLLALIVVLFGASYLLKK